MVYAFATHFNCVLNMFCTRSMCANTLRVSCFAHVGYSRSWSTAPRLIPKKRRLSVTYLFGKLKSPHSLAFHVEIDKYWLAVRPMEPAILNPIQIKLWIRCRGVVSSAHRRCWGRTKSKMKANLVCRFRGKSTNSTIINYHQQKTKPPKQWNTRSPS